MYGSAAVRTPYIPERRSWDGGDHRLQRMELPPFSLFFFFFVLLPMLTADSSADQGALLSLRAAISGDPNGAMDGWNDSTPLCRWRGVTCGGLGGAAAPVTELTLSGLKLAGRISPRLTELTSLTRLDLSNNQLEGVIPVELGKLAALKQLNLSINLLTGAIPADLGQLTALQQLDLSMNSLSGEIPAAMGNFSELIIMRLRNNRLRGRIPASISRCRKLQRLSFYNNQLEGEIPPELGSLPSLNFLQLSSNSLGGPIPSSLGNISSLSILDLSNNSLSGRIPPELGNLKNLSVLYLFTNELTGPLPPHLGNLSSLNYLYLYENQLEGEIPAEIGDSRNLKVFDVYVNRLSGRPPFSLYNLSSLNTLQVGYNQLSGPLPPELGKNLPSLGFLHLFGNQFRGNLPPFLSNATALELLEVGQNRLSGVIPSELGKLQSLKSLHLSDNSFQARSEDDWSFIAALSNCRNLTKLQLYNNCLGGALPASIANLSRSLELLRMDRNQIGGTLPDALGSFVNLGMLRMDWNKLSGRIPASIGELNRLKELQLEENELSGEIPSSLGSISGLLELSLGGNQLEGGIPATLGGLKNLQALNLSSNSLTGEIPREILSLVSLSSHLDLSGNDLSGLLPSEIGNLKNLKALKLSRNRLSGEIPSSVGDCKILQFLLLADNLFQGRIPLALRKLAGLQELDLSGNNLTGEVPEFLEDLHLRRLNLSYNFLQGEVPRGGIFQNATAASLVGNAGLCGGDPGLLLRTCFQRRSLTVIKTAVPISAILFVLLLMAFLFACFGKNRNKASPPPPTANSVGISYEELCRSTGGFSPANIIGRGAHGCVYSGTLGRKKQPVAVKVFKLGSGGAERSFTTECDALRNVRHRNLAKILASFSGADEQGKEFMALVYELLPNGSLDRWIHPEDSENRERKNMGILQRLSVAIDIASAMEYLHQCIDVPIIHGDLKPGNVLLDKEMTAKVGDFGLARFLSSGASHFTTGIAGLKGTIGYVAPELARIGKASTASDVYSFGILLLEMFTGKRPTDPAFVEGSTLRGFVAESLPGGVMPVVDPNLLRAGMEDEGGGFAAGQKRESLIKCFVSLFKLGLMCSEGSEKDRPKIAGAVRALTLTRDALLQPESRVETNGKLLRIEIER